MATRISYVEFSGTQYGTIPAKALGGAQVFTIEAVISTTSTKYNGTYYRWPTIVGVEIANTWKDDYSLCVNNGRLCFWAQSQRNTSPKNYKVESSARVNDGNRHKVAVVSNADGSIDLYCDGSKVAHTDSVEATIAYSAMYIAYNNGNDNSRFPMKLYELRLWNVARSQYQLFANINGNESGLRAWYVAENTSYMRDLTGRSGNATLYGSPTVFAPNNGIKLDVRRDIIDLSKGWLVGTLGKTEEIAKRIEPTTVSKGTTYTVPQDNDTIKRYFNYSGLPETQSKTGYAFDHFENTSTLYNDYFILNIPETKEFWIKFDVYIKTATGGVQVGDTSNGITPDRSHENLKLGDGGAIDFAPANSYNPAEAIFYVLYGYTIFENGTISKDDDIASVEFPAIKRNQLSTVLVHMRSGQTDGIIEAWYDGVKVQHDNIPDGTVTLNNGLRRYTNTSGSQVYSYYLAGFFKGNVNRGENFTDVYLKPWGLVSNVLVSNMRIGFDATTIEVNFSLDVSVEITPSITDLSLDVKIKIAQHFLISLDVKRSIIALYVDVLRNILAELIFSPLETEEIFHGASSAFKLKGTLRDTGTISANSFDSNEIERNVTSEKNTSGLQGLEINIAEQQLTDQVTFSGIMEYPIMQYIGGQYFDYLYKLRIESRQQQGILFTYHCCSNIDELLYTQIAYKVTTTETIQDDTQEQASEDTEDKSIEEEEYALLETGEYHTLTENAVAVATYFGLTPVVQLGEFAEFYSSYKEQDLWGRTYADAIREVFGWSSRIPHKLINVYIRDDKMFFVQRGSESNVIDITQTKHTSPVINQELIRTFWGTTTWSKTEIKEKIVGTRGLGGSGDNDNDDFPADYINNEEDDDGKDNPWTAAGTVVTTSTAGTSVTKYDYTGNGVLRGTTTTFTSNDDPSQNSTTVVKNSYNADGLLEAVQTTVTHPSAPEEDKQTVVKYGYLSLSGGQKFLASELTSEYERNSEGFFELVDTKATTKSPTGRGQGTSYDSKGKGTASGNVGDDRVTPYQLRSAFKTTEALSFQTLKRTTTTTINGFTDIDPSFPLLLLRDRNIITEYLKWLNRKTKETVSLSVYNFAHIIDFNDRIILNGKSYFVVSNNVKTTPRLYNEQKLTLVRWF